LHLLLGRKCEHTIATPSSNTVEFGGSFGAGTYKSDKHRGWEVHAILQCVTRAQAPLASADAFQMQSQDDMINRRVNMNIHTLASSRTLISEVKTVIPSNTWLL
jgi:hypothetical protein